MPDWKSQATLERLVAALIAANNGKVDNQAVARYMDETYDSVENRTRVYKREAQKLVKEAEQAGRMEMDMRKRGSTSPRKGGPHEPRATPSKKNAGGVKGVIDGRVTKTPTKKKSTAGVKHENISSDSSVFDDTSVMNAASFTFSDVDFASGTFNGDEWNNNSFA